MLHTMYGAQVFSIIFTNACLKILQVLVTSTLINLVFLPPYALESEDKEALLK